jgi:hypothetical protein
MPTKNGFFINSNNKKISIKPEELIIRYGEQDIKKPPNGGVLIIGETDSPKTTLLTMAIMSHDIPTKFLFVDDLANPQETILHSIEKWPPPEIELEEILLNLFPKEKMKLRRIWQDGSSISYKIINKPRTNSRRPRARSHI